MLCTAPACHPVPSCCAPLSITKVDGVEANSLSIQEKLLYQETIYFAAVDINCFPLQLLLPEQLYLWRGYWRMGKSSKDASFFLLSTSWWLCQLFGSCVIGEFLQILQFPFSLCCSDLLVPVFWNTGLIYRDHKNTTWTAQSLHRWWAMTWGTAALACHIGVVLTRRLLVRFC